MDGQPRRDVIHMSTADSEIAILYESHELLADIISPFLYGISGTASEQQAVFISDETLALFAIRVGEFLSAPTQAILVDDVPWKHSLLSGLELVAPQLREPSGPALKQCVGVVHDWMRKLPRQAHRLKSDTGTGVVALGRKVDGGTRPRASWARSVL